MVTGAATVGATLGIGAAGAAIGMFFTGISIGGAFGALLNNGDAVKKLMTSTADGLSAFDVLNGENLFNVGLGLGTLGVGLATLAGGKVFDAITGGLVDFGSGIVGRAQDLFEFFGVGEGSDNRGRFQKVADELDPLVKIGPQLALAGAGLKDFSLGFDALKDVGTSNLEENAAIYGRVAKALLQDFKLDNEEKSALANLEQMGKIDQDLSFIAKLEVVGIEDAIGQLESLEETFNQIAPRINFQALTPEGQGANVTTPTQINTGVSQNVTQQNNAPVIHIQPRPHTAGNSGPGN